MQTEITTGFILFSGCCVLYEGNTSERLPTLFLFFVNKRPTTKGFPLVYDAAK